MDALSARHLYFMRGISTAGFFRVIIAASVRATAVAVVSQFPVGYRESLCAERWSQVFEGRDVLIHDLLRTQVSNIHCVLLEGPYKIRKHPPDPDFSQKVILGYVLGKRHWDAFEEAKNRGKTHVKTAKNINLFK